MTRSRLITREARVEHTVELGCTIAGIFDFLRLCGNGIVDRLLDRNRTEPIPSEPFESARRCIGESTDLRAPHADKCMEIDPKGSVAARRQTPEGLPSIDLGQAVTREPALGDAVYAASAETRALRRAWKLMEPLVHGWGLPSRQQFGRLIEWSPVLEPLAYRCATRIGSLMCWPTRRSARRSRRSRTGPRSPGLRRGRLHRGLRHRARNAPDRRTCGSTRHPSRRGCIMTDRPATRWAQVALSEAIFGGRRSSDPAQSGRATLHQATGVP